MKIYKYSTRDLSIFKKSIDVYAKRKHRDMNKQKLVQHYIENHGTLVTIQEYFADHKRNFREYWDCAAQKWVDNDYSYTCSGKPTNCIERLAYAEIEFDNDLSYCDLATNSPEDLCKSRTDWEDLKGYADGLMSFVNQLKDEIAEGKITFTQKEYEQEKN